MVLNCGFFPFSEGLGAFFLISEFNPLSALGSSLFFQVKNFSKTKSHQTPFFLFGFIRKQSFKQFSKVAVHDLHWKSLIAMLAWY